MVSVDPEKAFDKIQHPFTIKTLGKLEVEGNLLNLVKDIHEIPMKSVTCSVVSDS